MEKNYTKQGYLVKGKDGKDVLISKSTIEKAVLDQTVLKDAIEKNILNLKQDLEAIKNI